MPTIIRNQVFFYFINLYTEDLLEPRFSIQNNLLKKRGQDGVAACLAFIKVLPPLPPWDPFLEECLGARVS